MELVACPPVPRRFLRLTCFAKIASRVDKLRAKSAATKTAADLLIRMTQWEGESHAEVEDQALAELNRDMPVITQGDLVRNGIPNGVSISHFHLAGAVPAWECQLGPHERHF